MKKIDDYQKIFDRYDNMMRAKQLQEERILYRPLQKLIEQGYVKKVRYGYYQWLDSEDFSEAATVIHLFPDAIFCRETALQYYGYSDRTPAEWHLAVSKNSGKSRFRINYPHVKPHYVAPSYLEIGLVTGEIDGHKARIYDRERVICDCLRYRNKMDKEILNRAIQGYATDAGKNVPKLLEYTKYLRVERAAKDLIGVWV